MNQSVAYNPSERCSPRGGPDPSGQAEAKEAMIYTCLPGAIAIFNLVAAGSIIVVDEWYQNKTSLKDFWRSDSY